MGFLKGSQEAKDHMSRIRALRGNRANTTEKTSKNNFCKMCGKKQN